MLLLCFSFICATDESAASESLEHQAALWHKAESLGCVTEVRVQKPAAACFRNPPRPASRCKSAGPA
eukprot:2793933-Pyramimonas_sp.AAC.1